MNNKALKEYRLRAGISQEKLAQEANLSVSMVQKLERGLTDGSTATVNALVNALIRFLPDSDNIILTVLMGRDAQEAEIKAGAA